MSKIQKTLHALTTTKQADFKTKQYGAPIALRDDGSSSMPIEVTIAGYWFGPNDLRHAAKLFNKLAERLEAEGRAE
ncbi:hypothetical protein EGY16_32890 [Burkholderia pseudomallei]|uniref:hypothetical protein n=1 Tax=Burkholderia pseudomallei TaxID=28450 RepID=UPI000F4F2AA6|nr:hypothetical protein [Burkholderia pseudomallei]AYX32627.1 hypothetical protein EGY16_32890 [Burkholderia pseudomallei]